MNNNLNLELEKIESQIVKLREPTSIPSNDVWKSRQRTSKLFEAVHFRKVPFYSVFIVLILFSQMPIGVFSRCDLGGSSECFQNFTVKITTKSNITFNINPEPRSTLTYSFNVTFCSPVSSDSSYCAISALLLTSSQYSLFCDGSLQFSSLPSVGNVFDVSSARVYVEWASNRDGSSDIGTYYLVFYNPYDSNTTISYTIEYSPLQVSCLLVILNTSAILLFFLALLCWFIYREKLKTSKQGEETEKVKLHIPDYPYVEPCPIEALNKCKMTLPFLKKQNVSFKIYWCQEDDILWIWYPISNETLYRSERIVITITFLLMQLFFQTIWSQTFYIGDSQGQLISSSSANALSPSSSGYIENLLLRVVSSGVFIWIIEKMYVPFIRCTIRRKPLWHDDSKFWKRIAGILLSSSSMILLCILILSEIVSLFTLLDYYTCSDFIYEILVPFLINSLLTRIFPGTIERFCTYNLKNTLGKKSIPEEHQQPLLDDQA